MPTKSNNIGGRGGARPGAGRKKTALKDKVTSGNPGMRPLEVLDIPDMEGVEMPEPHEFLSSEQKQLSAIARHIYTEYPCDGKYILDGDRLIICQSNAPAAGLKAEFPDAEINPLGDWTGGINVDSGATNRKLGSDMADSVTGGGLHGKDLSKADVSVNIHAFLKAQRTGEPVHLCCAIGDDTVDGLPYAEIVEEAGRFIAAVGGFEKFAEWGLF